MDLNQELGVKGYCFRGYKDNETVAAKVKECGADRIDLSGCQCDFRNPDEHKSTIKTYQNAGVKIVGIGAVGLKGDESDKQLFEFCKKAGCRTVSCSGDPETFFDAIAQADKWAEQYDMFAAIHNHGGKHWLGNSQMLKYVLGKVSPRVGLCIDTAWCIHAGEDPIQWLELFAGRVHAVHYKDYIFDRNGKHQDVIVGEGALDLPAFVKGLKAIDFEGPAVIEYEADVDNPVPALKKCVQKMRPILKAIETT